MPRQIRNEVKRDLANKLLMSVMNNLDFVLNSAITEKPEYQSITEYGLMKAAFALAVREHALKPRHNTTKQFISELIEAKFPSEPVEEASEA